MKIREGAYYRTRHGGVVGPMKMTDRSQRYTWAFLTDLWTPEGEFAIGEENPFDLISEVYVSDTPPADTPAPEAKTLRDEFAMRLMDRDVFMVGFKEEAEQLYRAADAMMEARKK
ncbi:hypothetical protein UFOVP670_18 [uncultured Caudovirales phage]|uniref:Uncharacterized protein n=1 Tax=uncultured Caudovirales phage TaxID=2100421 RepID=A0A6J5N975_9CAUD|nr:hypothetical protein UFOVP670_18 [uncultured Caudovirales phage]